MAANKLFPVLFILLLASCAWKRKLPAAKEIGVHPYGSYIKLKIQDEPNVKGEFITMDSVGLYVLPTDDTVVRLVPESMVHKVALRYAKPKSYGWTIPASIAVSLPLGYLGVTAMLTGLPTTIGVTASGASEFKFKRKRIRRWELMKFARFPQGFPPGVRVNMIR